MIKALIRSLFYLRSISKSLQKLTQLYELELRTQGIQLTDPTAPNSEVEVLYGTPPPTRDTTGTPWNQ